MTFNGLGMHMGNLWRLSGAKSRSISAENFTGEKGKGGMAVTGRNVDSVAAVPEGDSGAHIEAAGKGATGTGEN